MPPTRNARFQAGRGELGVSWGRVGCGRGPGKAWPICGRGRTAKRMVSREPGKRGTGRSGQDWYAPLPGVPQPFQWVATPMAGVLESAPLARVSRPLETGMHPRNGIRGRLAGSLPCKALHVKLTPVPPKWLRNPREVRIWETGRNHRFHRGRMMDCSEAVP